MDDILVDPCHINPDTPQIETSAPQAVVDWAASAAGDIWSTVTNREAMVQIGTGAWNYIKDPKGALKDIGIGLAARAAGIAAAVPASSYLLGREVTMLALKGMDAFADDTIKLAATPFGGIGNATPAARVLSDPLSTEAQKTAARTDLQNAGGSVTSLTAIGLGGVVGPQGLRTAVSNITSGARTTAMEIGIASFGDPIWSEPALAIARRSRAIENAGIAKGSPDLSKPTISVEAPAVVMNQTPDDTAGGGTHLEMFNEGPFSGARATKVGTSGGTSTIENPSGLWGKGTPVKATLHSDGSMMQEYGEPTRLFGYDVLRMFKAGDEKLLLENPGGLQGPGTFEKADFVALLRYSKRADPATLTGRELSLAGDDLVINCPKGSMVMGSPLKAILKENGTIFEYNPPMKWAGNEVDIARLTISRDGDVTFENPNGLAGPGSVTSVYVSFERFSQIISGSTKLLQ